MLKVCPASVTPQVSSATRGRSHACRALARRCQTSRPTSPLRPKGTGTKACHAEVMNGSTIDVQTPDGVADCYLTKPAGDARHPGVLLIMDAFGLRPRIEEMADRIAAQGYVVLAPNVFYRAGHAPLWEMPDVHDPDSRARFFRTLGPLMGALTPVVVCRGRWRISGQARGARRRSCRGHRLLLRCVGRLDDRRCTPSTHRSGRRLSRRPHGHRHRGAPTCSRPVSARRSIGVTPIRTRA